MGKIFCMHLNTHHEEENTTTRPARDVVQGGGPRPGQGSAGNRASGVVGESGSKGRCARHGAAGDQGQAAQGAGGCGEGLRADGTRGEALGHSGPLSGGGLLLVRSGVVGRQLGPDTAPVVWEHVLARHGAFGELFNRGTVPNRNGALAGDPRGDNRRLHLQVFCQRRSAPALRIKPRLECFHAQIISHGVNTCQ